MDSGPRTSPEAPSLGPAIAARVRPRLGIGRRSPLTRVSIGGMARTIAGFGRSLGLARSARPVPASGLSTTTVRPPVGYWPWAESLEPAAVTRTAPLTRATPTRTSIPSTVGSGDAKVDSLRRLLGLPPLVMSPPEPTADAGSGPSGRDTQPGLANATITSAGRRAGTTIAGIETGPGQLGRRLVPETVRADPDTTSVVPTAPQGAPTTTAARQQGSGSTTSSARDAAWPRQPAPPPARGTRDVESLRRSLAASGTLSNHGDGRDDTRRASTTRAAPREHTRPDGGRDAPSTVGVSAIGATTSPAGRLDDAARPGNVDGRDGGSPSAPTTSDETTASFRTSTRDDPPAATATAATNPSSRMSTRDDPPAATATAVPVLLGLDRTAGGLTTTTDQPIARSVTAADAVRLRRLIRQTSNRDSEFVPDVESAVVRPAGLILDQGLPEVEHDVAVAPLPKGARPERVTTRRATRLTPHDVLRRVSLPRSMSRRDRPISTLAAAVVRRRHEAARTSHSPDGNAAISARRQTSPTTGADVRPPATGRSKTRTDRADRAVPQRGDTTTSDPRSPLTTIAAAGFDPSAMSMPVTSRLSMAPPTAPSNPSPSHPSTNPPTSRPPTTTIPSTAARYSPSVRSAPSRDEPATAATVRRRAIIGDAPRASVQRASIRRPSRSMSTTMSTFSAAVDDRHLVTEADGDVSASRIAGESIHWPSPGTMFASAMLERRATDTAAFPGARRSVVAPGPGALRSVLRKVDVTADETSTANGNAAVRDGSRTGSTRHRAISAHALTAADPPRTERMLEAFRDTSRRPSDRPADTRRGVESDTATVGPPSVTTAAPSREHVAARFLTELSRGERRQPQPLPTPYRPMAQAITGHHRVLISTDDASRRALRAVNKVAATTGDVIHLAAPPAVGPRHTEVLAHELTHIAHPSPKPRFFADDDRGPEERRADEIARVIARSPLAPTAPIGHRATTTSPSAPSSSGDNVIRRSPASRSSRTRSTGGTVSAAALAEQIISGVMPTSSSNPTIRRFDEMPPLPPIPPPPSATSSSPPTAPPVDTSPGSKAFWEQVDSNEAGSEWFRSQLQANFDRIVRLLERHMIGELERRGGRNWKGY